jgi:hypothetical protein
MAWKMNDLGKGGPYEPFKPVEVVADGHGESE